MPVRVSGDGVGQWGTGVRAPALATMLVTALLLRLGWVALVPVEPVSDSIAYDAFARTLAAYGVFGWNPDHPFAFWPPGTSMVYAALYRLFGLGYGTIIILNLLLSLALLVFAMRIANRRYGQRCALYAGWTLALWPTLIMFTTVLASELLFIVLCAAALDAWGSLQTNAVIRGVVAGALLGAAALVRPVAMALPVLFAVGMLFESGWSKSNLAAQAKVGVAAALAMACVIAPWTLRNYHLYHDFIPVSTNGGITLWMGNAPGTSGEYMDLPAWTEKFRDNEQDRALGALARRYIADDPAGFLARSARKVVWLYNHESIGVAWNEAGLSRQYGARTLRPLKLFTNVTWALILAAAAWGTVSLARRHGLGKTLAGPIVLPIAFYSMVHGVVVSQDRYHLEFAVHTGILAGAALAMASTRSRARKVGVASVPP